MINMQPYAVTGRKYRPNYVDIINTERAYLPRRKELKDLEEYRNKTLGLEATRIANETQMARDTLEANKKSSDTSAMIGLGQLGASAYQGRTRDEKLSAMLGKGGGKDVPGSVVPTVGPSSSGTPGIGQGDYGGTVGEGGPGTTMDSVWSGLKGGAKNWGSIASGALVGGTVGAGLGEKYVPFGGQKERRAIGGAATAGALSYLSSGDPYSAAISALFGGAFGGFF